MSIPIIAVSCTLQTTEWNNSHILRDVATDVATLKNTDGGDKLVYGSATLVKALLHHKRFSASLLKDSVVNKLIDELRESGVKIERA